MPESNLPARRPAGRSAAATRAGSAGRSQAGGARRRPNRRPAASGSRKPARKRKPAAKSTTKSAKSSSSSKSNSLSKLLNPENIGETIKNVSNLRGMVKNWLRYLEQADQVLDTVFVTSNSLRESGVLNKIVKQRGKNLSTEDFTNILVALMNSPAGAKLFASNDEENKESNAKS